MGEILNHTHMSLATRINEVELQNYEILKELKEIKQMVEEFRNAFDCKTNNEKDTDILLRKVGILK